MAQRQPEQPSQHDRSRYGFQDEQDQRQPGSRAPIGYDEAVAGREPDGGESLLSGAPREGEADMVRKASQSQQFPQVNEAGTVDEDGERKQPGDGPDTKPLNSQVRSQQQ